MDQADSIPYADVRLRFDVMEKIILERLVLYVGGM